MDIFMNKSRKSKKKTLIFLFFKIIISLNFKSTFPVHLALALPVLLLQKV
jgi:hypothetical protein